MQLRLALESLVKCSVAGARFQDSDFIGQRLDLLDENTFSISKLAKEVGQELGVGDYANPIELSVTGGAKLADVIR